MSLVEEKRMGGFAVLLPKVKWKTFDGEAAVCRAALYRDEENGGFTAIAKNLPGVVSEGDSLSEAVSNVREAVELAIESYRDCHMVIPWGAPVDLPEIKPAYEVNFVVNLNG